MKKILIIALLLSSCSKSIYDKTMFHTPCNPVSAYASENECYQWQEDYPGEYKRWRLWIMKNAPEQMDSVILTDPMNSRDYTYNPLIF